MRDCNDKGEYENDALSLCRHSLADHLSTFISNMKKNHRRRSGIVLMLSNAAASLIRRRRSPIHRMVRGNVFGPGRAINKNKWSNRDEEREREPPEGGRKSQEKENRERKKRDNREREKKERKRVYESSYTQVPIKPENEDDNTTCRPVVIPSLDWPTVSNLKLKISS